MRHSGCGTALGRPPGSSLRTSSPPPLVDGFFRGASFCKYVCPIGQFHFVQSLVSPFEVKVRQPEVCTSCSTHICLHGNAQQRGCELNLFQPKKLGNFDCTFCLDCVHSCSHGNVGLIAIVPGASIVRDRRLSRRRDVGVLVGLSVFGAFISAAVMTGPVMMWLHQWHARLGSMLAATTLFLSGGPGALPGLLVFLCGRAKPELTGRFLLALVPLGFSMWLAHFCYHLVTRMEQRDSGSRTHPGLACLRDHTSRCIAVVAAAVSDSRPRRRPSTQPLPRLEDRLQSRHAGERRAGTAGSLGDPRRRALLAGLWILGQPMEMRGMVMR